MRRSSSWRDWGNAWSKHWVAARTSSGPSAPVPVVRAKCFCSSAGRRRCGARMRWRTPDRTDRGAARPPALQWFSTGESCCMTAVTATKVYVGSVEDVRARGCVQVSGGGHGIAVFAHEDRFYALDNRCPHMGFPLSRGTVQDGLLTCHWHHARFDLEGGGTLDPFADNVRRFPVEVESGAVLVVVGDAPAEDSAAHWLGRLEDGMEHQLEFVLAKACIALVGGTTDPADIVRTVGRYGLRYRRRGWGMGMTILTALGSL